MIINATETMEWYFGQRLVWCVSGFSFGVHDLQWAWSQDPHLETVNISANVSDTSYLSCEFVKSNYYSPTVQEYLQNKTVGGARGVAFSVLGYKFNSDQFNMSWLCSGVPNYFLSFVIIDEVNPYDNGTKLLFNITSFTGHRIQENYSINACMNLCACIAVLYIALLSVRTNPCVH